MSGLGKGICAASLGRLLKQCGLRVRNQKFDPYLNVDPGTMSPYQHGEVFVTEDGAETDLDLGHYERFTDEDLTVDSSITSGKVYWSVLSREREGGLLGGARSRSSHTSPVRSRSASTGLAAGRRWTWSSPRSAAPPAILKASLFWRRSGRCRTRWAGTTACFFT